MGERLTRGQAALRVGVTRQRIDELIKGGKLREEGATVDSEELDELWETFSPDHVNRDRNGKEMRGGGGAKVPNATAEIYNKAKAKSAIIKSQEAELDLKIKQGLFVSKQAVIQQCYSATKRITSRLQALPRQLAPELALLLSPGEVQDRLSKEIDALLQDLRDGLSDLGGRGAAD